MGLNSNTTNNFRFSLLIIAILFLLPTGILAQDSNSFVGIRSGISIPFGKYHSNSFDGGSFTMAGFNASAEGAWFFSSHFGIGMSASFNLHPIDVSALGRARMNRDAFLSQVVIRSEPFTIITAMPGLFADYKFGKKWTFTWKILGGLLYGKTPYQLHKPDYYILPNNWEEITPAKDWKFSWMAGVGTKYKVSSCISLVFDADVMYDKLKFNFQTASGLKTDERTIGIINLTLGIRINL